MVYAREKKCYISQESNWRNKFRRAPKPKGYTTFRRIEIPGNFQGRLICNLISQIKRLIRGEHETLRVRERFVAGSLAGAIAQTIIYPMEVR